MEPFYFGENYKLLFGIYHPPLKQVITKCGIVLCYPIGQEYLRCYRAFNKLAISLSASGFHVLRFDYYCSGDSYGDVENLEINQTLDDLSMAIEELKGGSGLEKICLIGIRMGATIAINSSLRRQDVSGVALWDPVVNGKEYFNEIKTLHREWLKGSFSMGKMKISNDQIQEILGFPFSDSLIKELENIDMLSINKLSTKNILLINSVKEINLMFLKEYLEKLDTNVDYQNIETPEIWIKKNSEKNKALVPIKILNSIKSWVERLFL